MHYKHYGKHCYHFTNLLWFPASVIIDGNPHVENAMWYFVFVIIHVVSISSYKWHVSSSLFYMLARLQSSNHRRYVRPKLRQKPSLDHLKQLMERNDVTSDISPELNNKRKSKIDPNTYSTYMGEHYLEPVNIVLTSL